MGQTTKASSPTTENVNAMAGITGNIHGKAYSFLPRGLQSATRKKQLVMVKTIAPMTMRGATVVRINDRLSVSMLFSERAHLCKFYIFQGRYFRFCRMSNLHPIWILTVVALE